MRSRLVLENDERSYGAEDALFLNKALGVPVVFDYLHHTALAKELPNMNLLRRICGSWSISDGCPKFHYSAQKLGSRAGSHADMLDVEDFLRFVQVLPSSDVDILLEVKAKDLALLALRSELWGRPHSLKGWNII